MSGNKNKRPDNKARKKRPGGGGKPNQAQFPTDDLIEKMRNFELSHPVDEDGTGVLYVK
jgi:hypothetical protein